jgi:hypothetical protein
MASVRTSPPVPPLKFPILLNGTRPVPQLLLVQKMQPNVNTLWQLMAPTFSALVRLDDA